MLNIELVLQKYAFSDFYCHIFVSYEISKNEQVFWFYIVKTILFKLFYCILKVTYNVQLTDFHSLANFKVNLK